MRSILDIPEYADAVSRESVIRDASYLDLTETVCGFELLPMTLRHYITLRTAGNPILNGGFPSPDEMVSFLWILSPDYTPGIRAARRFVRRCLMFIPPSLPWLRTSRAMARWELRARKVAIEFNDVLIGCRKYAVETFIDSPPGTVTGYTKRYYSDATAICAMLAREYGWRESDILNMPMKRIHQYLTELRRTNRPGDPLGNPSDKELTPDRVRLIAQN